MVLTKRGVTAARGIGVATMVLIYQALHDTWSFNKKRLDAITVRVNTYSWKINQDNSQLQKLRDNLDQLGIRFQLSQDFIKNLKKALKFSGRAENEGSVAGAEVVYILIFNALHDLYGFGERRLRQLQLRIKTYTWALLDEEVEVWDYMKCLYLECSQHYESLDQYEKEYGPVDIYGGNSSKEAVIKEKEAANNGEKLVCTW